MTFPDTKEGERMRHIFELGKMVESGIPVSNWKCFKRQPFYTKEMTLIIYTECEDMAIVKWIEDGWDGSHWYISDEEHCYKEENILYWMEAPTTPK